MKEGPEGPFFMSRSRLKSLEQRKGTFGSLTLPHVKIAIPGDIRIDGERHDAGTSKAPDFRHRANKHVVIGKDVKSNGHTGGTPMKFLRELIAGKGDLAGAGNDMLENQLKGRVYIGGTGGSRQLRNPVPNAANLSEGDHRKASGPVPIRWDRGNDTVKVAEQQKELVRGNA